MISSNLRNKFLPIKKIYYNTDGFPVEKTSAEFLSQALNASIHTIEESETQIDGLRVDVHKKGQPLNSVIATANANSWIWIHINDDGTGELVASQPSLLYSGTQLLINGLSEDQYSHLKKGLLLEVAFDWNRPLYDYTLAQSWRSTRKFNDEEVIRYLAECGFTHLEVNALSTHVPLEPGVPHEYYSQFYTYCADLTQFIDSKLIRGVYPSEYLQANLNRLKHLAALGRKYGLKPGMLAFTPRSLPEIVFQKYPTLRGARIDHPMRSHMPRYTLAQDHPASRAHYRELMQNLMREVPDLDYLSVWTNDSGAGFEYTSSLYVGRNGGPYMIREWRSHEKIAEAAGNSAIRWLKLMRDSAAEINPDFTVSLRVEPFKVEHDTIIKGMGNGLTVEAPSLLVRGYELPYEHNRYPEQKSVAGTIHHTELDPSEKEKLQEFRSKGFEPILNYSPASGYNVEPLLGLPFPRMLYKKLVNMKENGFKRISAFGGLLNTSQTPYWPNPEVIKLVQLNSEQPLDEYLLQIAQRWAGEKDAQSLVDLWNETDRIVSWLPVVPLYSNFGFVWLRTWVRPIVPDIEAVPKEDRLYYERFMVSTPNNPSINDLGRDVLFELISEENGRLMVEQFDDNVLKPLNDLIDKTRSLGETAEGQTRSVFIDLYERLRAFKCWSRTQRNTCAWVAGVYGYLRSEDDTEKKTFRGYLSDMVSDELENARDLLDLWETATTEFMPISGVGETSYLYGENLGELIKHKIDLMQKYGDREPNIDRDILWRLD